MIKRIAITGPESTGKSSLARELAYHYQTVFVPEIARSYIDGLKRPYKQSDLLEIAKLQCAEEDKLVNQANKILICDTDLFVIKIWSEFKFGNCDKWIMEELQNRKYHLHLLCNVDLHWIEDPQREHPYARKELFDRYHYELKKTQREYEIITGSEAYRLKKSVAAIDSLK